MAGNRGYRSYRGKGSKKKGLLAVFLALVILAAIGVAFLQKHIIYDETGAPHLEVPWQEEESTEPEESVELDLVIQPTETQEEILGYTIPLGEVSLETCTPVLTENSPWNAVAVILKDDTGAVYYDSAVATYNTARVAVDTAEALQILTEVGEELHTIAKISCFHDPKAANGNIEGMGLKNTGGYIFYDGGNSQWLDPTKKTARQYLCEIAREVAEMGFREILLTDVSYPTEGKLDKIAYGDGERTEHMIVFLQEMRSALESYGVKLSIELPADVIAAGRDDAAGLVLAQIAPEVDRIYAAVLPEETEAYEAAVHAADSTVQFVPILSASAAVDSGSALIQ